MVPWELELLNNTIPTESLYIVEFAPDVAYETLEWIVRKFRQRVLDNGAELIVKMEPYDPSKGFRIHLSCTMACLVKLAESVRLKKFSKKGQLREFSLIEIDQFIDSPEEVHGMFTSAEKQGLLRYALYNLRAAPHERFLPGYPNIRLYHGQSIDEVRAYFGQGLAMYFSFLGFYTSYLILPALFGCFQLLLWLLNFEDGIELFCIFNVLWATIFIEMWKRRSNELAYTWGTLTPAPYDDPRANYRGKLLADPVTGQIQPYYPRWKTLIKVYCGSLPVVFLCLLVAFYIMLWSFWSEEWLLAKQKEEWPIHDLALYIPGIVYTLIIVIMNRFYRIFATRLTEWENHRTESQFERNRVVKLVLFEFVNNFMSLFYIAFYLQNMEMLRMQIATMLIVLQFLNHFEEALLPIALRYGSEKVEELLVNYLAKKKRYRRFLEARLKKEDAENRLTAEDIRNLKTDEISSDNPAYRQAVDEGLLESYYGTIEDYLELFIQFGYVFLFSAVYPMAGILALLNNLLEIRADAFKMCKVFQRPPSMKVRHIGAWQPALQFLGALSVLTNCGLLYLSPSLRSSFSDWSETSWLLLWAGVEHLILALQLVLAMVIPNVPLWVRQSMARSEHEIRRKLEERVHSDLEKRLSKPCDI
ncbi:anoctamin-8-like isoform X2 [Artemia franciscana]|uniref:anoctamin-8-like isoform X2 n=1 Tax=Artemia franciscana TaxID=6661 RepID=UPI0032DBA85F